MGSTPAETVVKDFLKKHSDIFVNEKITGHTALVQYFIELLSYLIMVDGNLSIPSFLTKRSERQVIFVIETLSMKV